MPVGEGINGELNDYQWGGAPIFGQSLKGVSSFDHNLIKNCIFGIHECPNKYINTLTIMHNLHFQLKLIEGKGDTHIWLTQT